MPTQDRAAFIRQYQRVHRCTAEHAGNVYDALTADPDTFRQDLESWTEGFNARQSSAVRRPSSPTERRH